MQKIWSRLWNAVRAIFSTGSDDAYIHLGNFNSFQTILLGIFSSIPLI